MLTFNDMRQQDYSFPSSDPLFFKLITQTHNYNTRSKFIVSDQLVNTKHLFIPIERTLHYGLKQIKVQGAKIWNDLPHYTRIITSLGSFNTKLYRHLVEKYKSNI